MANIDLLLFPHCDLHVAKNVPALTIRLFRRADGPANSYILTEIPHDQWKIDFFAPHNTVGERFNDLPKVNGGVVSATKLGVYLFQVRYASEYIVGRLQVHDELETWWFGNDSITTAKDTTHAHAQPSIYGKFSDDGPGPGTDLIGDITGHGYVTLKSNDMSKVVVAPRGRLQGIAETSSPVTITGTWPAGSEQLLDVRVVDYDKKRPDLVDVQAPDTANSNDLHNILFLAEGFTDTEADKKLFDKTVQQVTDELFDKRRHQPYGMLEKRFNVFKAFAASQQNGVTCGFRVTDTSGGYLQEIGAPIPFNGLREEQLAQFYTMYELVTRVGLPKRGENRDPLLTVWDGQYLPDFTPTMVDTQLLEAWKVHQSVGILQTQDTFFGLQWGARLADRTSTVLEEGETHAEKPARDDIDTPELKKFIGRLYEFYRTVATRVPTLDPRRHPPELYKPNMPSPRNAVLRYIASLEHSSSPSYSIGSVWQPDGTFKPSRGLVAVICRDNFFGGVNFNSYTLTALGLTRDRFLSFHYPPSGNKIMRRDPPQDIEVDTYLVTDIVAHEFGHSFSLGDEYESFRGDGRNTSTDDHRHDNISTLGFLRKTDNLRFIDPAKVKWATLPRIKISARLVAASATAPDGIRVTIDPHEIHNWLRPHADSADVHLLNRTTDEFGRQLPLTPTRYLTGLKIMEEPDPVLGTLVLGGPGLPSQPYPTFAAGSAVFVSMTDDQDVELHVVDKRVMAHLNKTLMPLNADPDTTEPNKKIDLPVAIGGLTPPPYWPKLVGVYEGADAFAGGRYRPAGSCKMRGHKTAESRHFCFVCMWLIVNRIDPTQHAYLNQEFYPEAK